MAHVFGCFGGFWRMIFGWKLTENDDFHDPCCNVESWGKSENIWKHLAQTLAKLSINNCISETNHQVVQKGSPEVICFWIWSNFIEFHVKFRLHSYTIGSMYAIYGNIYHQYTPNDSIYCWICLNILPPIPWLHTTSTLPVNSAFKQTRHFLPPIFHHLPNKRPVSPWHCKA